MVSGAGRTGVPLTKMLEQRGLFYLYLDAEWGRQDLSLTLMLSGAERNGVPLSGVPLTKMLEQRGLYFFYLDAGLIYNLNAVRSKEEWSISICKQGGG
jgi:hypothetical protein